MGSSLFRGNLQFLAKAGVKIEANLGNHYYFRLKSDTKNLYFIFSKM